MSGHVTPPSVQVPRPSSPPNSDHRRSANFVLRSLADRHRHPTRRAAARRHERKAGWIRGPRRFGRHHRGLARAQMGAWVDVSRDAGLAAGAGGWRTSQLGGGVTTRLHQGGRATTRGKPAAIRLEMAALDRRRSTGRGDRVTGAVPRTNPRAVAFTDRHARRSGWADRGHGGRPTTVAGTTGKSWPAGAGLTATRIDDVTEGASHGTFHRWTRRISVGIDHDIRRGVAAVDRGVLRAPRATTSAVAASAPRADDLTARTAAAAETRLATAGAAARSGLRRSARSCRGHGASAAGVATAVGGARGGLVITAGRCDRQQQTDDH